MIESINSRRVVVPVEHHQRSVGGPDSCANLLVWVVDNSGVSGECCIWATGVEDLVVYEAAVARLAADLVGLDPHDTDGLHDKLWASLRYQLGTKGVGVTAAAGLESAVWDLVGRLEGRSVSSMLGRKRDAVAVDHGAVLWFDSTVDQLEEEAAALVAEGFGALKMRVGLFGPEEDARRAARVRRTVGADVELAVDCLQLFSVDAAVDFGRRVEELELAWIEDPLTCTDLVGHAHLVEVLDTPIATGEHEYGVHGFENLIARRAADVLLVDLMRVGGVKDFMTVAAMAEDVGIDIVSHCFPEQSVQLLAAAGDVRFAEHSNWWSPLYNETLTINDGQYLIPDRPGFGFTFVDDVLERFRPEPHTS